MAEIKFCEECGSRLHPHRVAGELRNHWYCSDCAKRRYAHPKIVVTTFVACGKRLLWLQRNLEPQSGLWAIPGGFLESRETLADGAARELFEETGIRIPSQRLQFYMTGTITFINQIYVAFRATVETQQCLPGVEARDCRFFSRQDCPWEQVAYPEVNDSIIQAYDDLDTGQFGIWQAEMTESRYNLFPVSQSSDRRE